ncbi:MAG TPA: acyl-CoA dehydrogenase [Acidimicrobiaceae bacterium]|nr:acyl-CoA dehydrogenase [Acidimicrobiaceae bacterium]HAQ23719.1 acyl-CoA dehydrogenase [Acidimicrobiaceae bacterium]HCV33487.1 acyl-CoA dehydrogenase [Acidimicrobiaceae bacterium]|tara:strand:- start:248 stop:1459 length:1212 start_codon:yes stop_codon:yes gene_type:complete
MEVSRTLAERAFADEVRTWLEEHLVGEFADLRGRGGVGQEDVEPKRLLDWERELASGGWLGLDYPSHLGGRDASLSEQVIFHQTYVEARAPGRIPNIGLTLLGPTLVAYGSSEQQERFIPPILAGTEHWCQGYSEPNAGSDLANVSTRARLDGDRWLITGQKIWTSLAQLAQWAFVVCRTDPDAERHHGLSYLLVNMDQPGVEIRPIVQITGGTEFNEVFFDEAETAADMVVGRVGDGWSVAMGTLGFERGASTLGQQTGYRQELDALLELARANGSIDEPVLRQDLVQAWLELEVLRYNQLRMLTALVVDGVPGPEMSIGKLYWASWHRRLGELGMRVRGASAMVGIDPTPPLHDLLGCDYQLDGLQRTFLYSRAHTIYGGSNEVQRNVLGERVLGLSREPR